MGVKKEKENFEHEDLEERFQLSAEIEFEFSNEQQFEGLKPIEIKIKKKQEKKTIIENVELRKNTGGLF